MHREPAYRHADRLRRERLDLELAETRAVERVRDVRPEGVEVEVLGTAADLLVDGERHTERGPRALRMAHEIGDGGHDLRDPGLVVRAEERRPVARDDVVADAFRERGKRGGIEHLARVAGKLDRIAGPGPV